VTRPAVSVVMPFAGTAAQAHPAVRSLARLELGAGDELILADNSGTAERAPGVTVVRASGERSPAHARNAGAAAASRDWILFIDADCNPAPGLIDAYFAAPVDGAVGALAGEIVPAAGAASLAARYAAARNFLGHAAHLAHPYRPRAAAANVLVRRSAFAQLGGFYEGLRAAEDTDLCWRLQEAGWELRSAPGAVVEHRYRDSVGDLRRQWRGYAAGRAWLARRYEGFAPEPALVRALRRAGRGGGGAGAGGAGAGGAGDGGAGNGGAAAGGAGAGGARGGPRYLLVLDAVLAVDELVGFALSNRPARLAPPAAEVVLVADRFPAAEAAPIAPGTVRVEAARRPPVVPAAGAVGIDYREDDGAAARAAALVRLVARHPVRCARDVARSRRPGEPPLSALAPAALRLRRDRGAPVRALGGPGVAATARRLAALAGSELG
jgi:GT2 family glycosyltransferase